MQMCYCCYYIIFTTMINITKAVHVSIWTKYMQLSMRNIICNFVALNDFWYALRSQSYKQSSCLCQSDFSVDLVALAVTEFPNFFMGLCTVPNHVQNSDVPQSNVLGSFLFTSYSLLTYQLHDRWKWRRRYSPSFNSLYS